jgi:two-component system, sensor histidine kinase and response regulator
MEKKEFTILVVDDEPADVEILRRLLGEIEGWKIQLRVFNDAETGRAEASRGRADLLFLDYLLGMETGLEVFQQIREEGCNLPVIMLTGHGSEEIAVEAMKAGVSDYLVKGRITPDSLRLVISNALQKFEMLQQIDEQRATLLDAERQRVMMESVGAACHHFAQPLTTMLSNLEILARDGAIEEPQKSLMLQQCLRAAEMMKMILNKFQQVNEYRTRPYLDDAKILDIGLESIYGTSPESEEGNKGDPKPGKQ